MAARIMALALGALLVVPGVAAQTPPRDIDLAAAFGTRSPWRLHVTQGAPVKDVADDTAPGALDACISRDGGRTCALPLADGLAMQPGDDWAQPHYLNTARIVHPASGRTLLLLQLASLHGANGDQRVGTWLFAYNRAFDRFIPAYRFLTNRNNNQEARYLDVGPLKGAMVSAAPTRDVPFGFWITVWHPDAALHYRQVLRYRSTTRYGDGNPLAVIDSEMPSILRQLGLWHRGQPLPAPVGCREPHLVSGALWCTRQH